MNNDKVFKDYDTYELMIKYFSDGIDPLDCVKEIKRLNEDSTDDAKGTLDAIIGFLKKQDSLDKDGEEMLKMANGFKDYFDKEGSFSPKQASWIFKTSKALF